MGFAHPFTGKISKCHRWAGKCAECQLTTHDVSKNLRPLRKYGIEEVPTVIIDGEVKIEGRLDIPFVCSDETYAHFRQHYPLTTQMES